MINHMLRGVEQDDLNFIYNSWLKSNRKSDSCKRITNDIYYYHEGQKITKLLNRSAIIVACNRDNPQQIFGWCVAEIRDEVPIVHYIYVKYPYRRLKLGKLLLSAVSRDSEAPIMCTHIGWKWEDLKDRYNLLHNPYLIQEK